MSECCKMAQKDINTKHDWLVEGDPPEIGQEIKFW